MPPQPDATVTVTADTDGAYAPSDEDTAYPPIRLTPDKSELLRLKREAHSVIIGNPVHLNILMDSQKRLILVPREPGATYFTVLDDAGAILMQRHVIVAAPKEDYIRVRRTCMNMEESTGCQATRVYYCPDMCHEIAVGVVEEKKGAANSAATAADNASDMAGGTPAGDPLQ